METPFNLLILYVYDVFDYNYCGYYGENYSSESWKALARLLSLYLARQFQRETFLKTQMNINLIIFQEAPILIGMECYTMCIRRGPVCSVTIMVLSKVNIFWKNCLHAPAISACFIVSQTPDVSRQASWPPVCVASILRSTWRQPPSLPRLGPGTPTCQPTKDLYFNTLRPEHV